MTTSPKSAPRWSSKALVYTSKVPENRVALRWTGAHLPFVSTADEQAELQNRVVAIILR